MEILIQRRNPSILSARRLGTMNSVLIIFEDEKVPYHVYYQGAEYRCYLHKKKHKSAGTAKPSDTGGPYAPRKQEPQQKFVPSMD